MGLEGRQAQPTPPEPHRFLRRALFRLRWATILILLPVTFMQPTVGRAGLPTWALILTFAGYNLLVEVLRGRVSALRSYTVVALLDLPVVGLLYSLAAEPGGPLFLLLFLAADCAAVSLTLRGALLYTGAVATLAALTDSVALMWSPTPPDIRLLVVRLTMLALVALGMASLSERLMLEGAATQAERVEAERLATLEQLRADFIATVSHDLQTPLTAARAGLAMLEMGALERLDLDQRDLLGTSRRNVEYLTILIGDLLTYNQLAAGTLRLDREPVDLRAVVAAALRVVHPLLREKGQSLEVDLPGPLPCLGDMRRLEQVLINLLANAHRHTPAGSRITLTGRAATGEIRLTVGDDGPGIPAGEQEAIFRRFHRLGTAGEGSGLGLAIARRIIELHGGQLAVESAPAAGAHFHITLPAAAGGAT